MRRADHAGLGIGEQHRRAIGGQDAERDPGPVGHHRVGMRAQALVPRPGHRDAIGRMDLVRVEQDRAGQHRVARQPAVFGDDRGIVVRSGADIEPGIEPGRYPAAPPEKAVRHVAQRAARD